MRRRRELFFDERLFALRLAERLAFLLPPFFADAFLREERLFGAMTLNDLGLRVRGNSFELHHKGSRKNENDKFYQRPNPNRRTYAPPRGRDTFVPHKFTLAGRNKQDTTPRPTTRQLDARRSKARANPHTKRRHKRAQPNRHASQTQHTLQHACARTPAAQLFGDLNEPTRPNMHRTPGSIARNHKDTRHRRSGSNTFATAPPRNRTTHRQGRHHRLESRGSIQIEPIKPTR